MPSTGHHSNTSDTGTIMGVRAPVVFWAVFVSAVIPSAWFIGMSYLGLKDILLHLHSSYSETTLPYLTRHAESNDPSVVHDIVRAHLDFDTLSNRQARANSLLSTRTWLRFMSSGFGSILIFVGAIFLLSRIESSSNTVLSAGNQGAWLKLASSSPGILMVAIGAFLMVSPNFSGQVIDTRDPSPFLSSDMRQIPDISDRPNVRAFINDLAKED